MSDFSEYEAFSPSGYLRSYYGELKSEAEGLLRFLVDSFHSQPDGVSVLEFGGGPTLIGLIPAARRAGHIHFCDYVEENRKVIERWLAGDESDFDWSPYLLRSLQLEGTAEPTAAQIEQRAARIRTTVGRVTTCDITQSPPVATGTRFDVVITNYCLDAVTGDKAEWQAHIRNLKTLLKPGGLFIMSSLKRASYSDFGGTRYPNVHLIEEDVREALKLAGFTVPSINVESAAADHEGREYQGVIFASAYESL